MHCKGIKRKGSARIQKENNRTMKRGTWKKEKKVWKGKRGQDKAMRIEKEGNIK